MVEELRTEAEGAKKRCAKLEEALEIGREAGGDYVIFGAFTQFGDGASLDVQCVPLREPSLERTLAARRIFVQSGAIGEIIPKLDELVRTHLDLSIGASVLAHRPRVQILMENFSLWVIAHLARRLWSLIGFGIANPCDCRIQSVQSPKLSLGYHL